MAKRGLVRVASVLAILTMTTSTVVASKPNVEVTTHEVKMKTLTGSNAAQQRISKINILERKGPAPINIDATIFSRNTVRLNSEIYNVSNDVITEEHADKCLKATTVLGESFVSNLNPLIPLALSVCETGSWANTEYTWTPAIYSKALSNKNVSMNDLKVEEVNVDLYLASGLSAYVGCGGNCAANGNQHYHEKGYNDNSSLGPLQILRQYVEGNQGYIVYDCGEYCSDLMSWKDNVEYIYHSQGRSFTKEDNWNKDYSIRNPYELVALMGVAHNTGNAFLNAGGGTSSAGSLWHNAEAVYRYCAALTSEESIEILKRRVDTWYEEVLICIEEDRTYSMLGACNESVMDDILKEIGLNKTSYASSFQHKQYYPLKALLNYMSLEKLYYSGY